MKLSPILFLFYCLFNGKSFTKLRSKSCKANVRLHVHVESDSYSKRSQTLYFFSQSKPSRIIYLSIWIVIEHAACKFAILKKAVDQ